MKIANFLKNSQVQDDEIEIVMKLFRNKIARHVRDNEGADTTKSNLGINIGNSDLVECVNYNINPTSLRNLLPSIKSFLGNKSHTITDNRKLLILLSKCEVPKKVKEEVFNFIVRSKERIYVKYYLSFFFEASYLTKYLKEIIAHDFRNHDIYVEILIQNECLDFLKEILRIDKITNLTRIEILQYLYFCSKEKEVLTRIEDVLIGSKTTSGQDKFLKIFILTK